ncbi:MAG: carbohydrate ABC transporter permease [Ruminococcus sp.]|nr:carbohydrate ABC transporter permease [Ruminococcus sp.]
MKIKKSPGEKIFNVINILIMLFLMFICFYPLWYVLVCSLSDSMQIFGNKGFILWPRGFSLSAYKAVLNNPDIASGYMNTVKILVCGTVLNVFFTSIGAFVVTRKKFKLAKPMMLMMIISMYFSGGMIPGYLLVMNTLHLGNTLWAVILPGAISTYNLIILKTSFATIPDSLEEAATIDGANDLTVFWRIMLPLSLPALAVQVLFYGVSYWNAWFSAMLYLEDRALYPLQLILREILIVGNTNEMEGAMVEESYNLAESIRYATIIVTTLPILAVYPFVQKYFVKGMMVGAVKG